MEVNNLIDHLKQQIRISNDRKATILNYMHQCVGQDDWKGVMVTAAELSRINALLESWQKEIEILTRN